MSITGSEMLGHVRRMLGRQPPDEHTYVQHSPENYRAARNIVLEYARRHVPGFAWPSNNDDVNIFGILGRWVDDNGPDELKSAWCRLMCIHPETFREHEQPAHVSSPPINCRPLYSSASPIVRYDNPTPTTTLHDQIVNRILNTEQEDDMETSEAANERLQRLISSLGEIGVPPDQLLQLLQKQAAPPPVDPAPTRSRTVRLD